MFDSHKKNSTTTREINRWLNYVPDDDIPNINAKEEKISNYSQ